MYNKYNHLVGGYLPTYLSLSAWHILKSAPAEQNNAEIIYTKLKPQATVMKSNVLIQRGMKLHGACIYLLKCN